MKKELFFEFIDKWEEYSNEIDKLSKYFGIGIWETKLFDSVGKMFDLFIDSHFTTEGADWINAYVFEDWRGKIYSETGEQLFIVNDLEDLWDYLCADPKTYFK